MKKSVGKKPLSLRIPADLLDMFAKLCIGLGITRTEAIIQYFKYLRKFEYNKRDIINEKSKHDFQLDASDDE